MGIIRMLLRRLRKRTEQERKVADDIVVLFEREYAEFREDTLKLPKSYIYDSAGMIRFYDNIRDFVLYSEYIDYSVARKINTSKPIAALWRVFTDSDYLTVDNYEEIEALFEATFPIEQGENIICLHVG